MISKRSDPRVPKPLSRHNDREQGAVKILAKPRKARQGNAGRDEAKLYYLDYFMTGCTKDPKQHTLCENETENWFSLPMRDGYDAMKRKKKWVVLLKRETTD